MNSTADFLPIFLCNRVRIRVIQHCSFVFQNEAISVNIPIRNCAEICTDYHWDNYSTVSRQYRTILKLYCKAINNNAETLLITVLKLVIPTILQKVRLQAEDGYLQELGNDY